MIQSAENPIEKKEEVVPIKVEIPKDSVLRRIVPPHEKVSRAVTDKDIERVVEESKILHAICFEPMGMYGGAWAMHHSQIDDKDPLNFFVIAEKRIIVNPKITRHTKTTVNSLEGCRSFSSLPEIVVQRWNKIETEFQSVMVDPDKKDRFKLSGVIKEGFSGFNAFVWQHEIGHSQGVFIYQLNKK